MPGTPDKSRIPLCRSDFLQGVTIRLGRWLKGLRYQSGTVEFNVDCDDDSEKFRASVRLSGGGYIEVNVWESGELLYVRREPREGKKWLTEHATYTKYRIMPGKLDEYQIANLIRDTLKKTWIAPGEDMQTFWGKLGEKELD